MAVYPNTAFIHAAFLSCHFTPATAAPPPLSFSSSYTKDILQSSNNPSGHKYHQNNCKRLTSGNYIYHTSSEQKFLLMTCLRAAWAFLRKSDSVCLANLPVLPDKSTFIHIAPIEYSCTDVHLLILYQQHTENQSSIISFCSLMDTLHELSINAKMSVKYTDIDGLWPKGCSFDIWYSKLPQAFYERNLFRQAW